MTPREAITAFNQWAEETLPPNASVSVFLNSLSRHDRKSLTCVVYASGVVNDRTYSVEADTFDELLAAAWNEWETRKAGIRAEKIRRLAFAIMDISDGGLPVEDRDLRLKGFKQPDIDELGGAACEEASRLGAGPFSIVTTQAANAA